MNSFDSKLKHLLMAIVIGAVLDNHDEDSNNDDNENKSFDKSSKENNKSNNTPINPETHDILGNEYDDVSSCVALFQLTRQNVCVSRKAFNKYKSAEECSYLILAGVSSIGVDTELTSPSVFNQETLNSNPTLFMVTGDNISTYTLTNEDLVATDWYNFTK